MQLSKNSVEIKEIGMNKNIAEMYMHMKRIIEALNPQPPYGGSRHYNRTVLSKRVEISSFTAPIGVYSENARI